MNPDIKQKWIAALRSGEYLQGRESLKQTHNYKTEYCCLGVLCEVAGITFDENNGMGHAYHAVKEMIGVENTQTLIHKNDKNNDSFHVIADWIEKNL